jgi:CMP-N-acetylneuraminic acid synthetase
VSTDKADYKAPFGVYIHNRDKKLAAKNSCVKDLIELIIEEYKIEDSNYLWLLNPTSPFKSEDDYLDIKDIVEAERPPALISAVRIIPYIWRNNAPLFATKGKRRNTDDFEEEYAVENGMFYVMNAGYFRKNKSWYGNGVRLYKQNDIWSAVDIDAEYDFTQAQNIGKLWKRSRGEAYAES